MTELARDPELDPAGDESTLLRGSFLDYQRTILLRKAEGITEAQSRTRLEPSEMTLIGLIRHMAEVERSWFRRRFAAQDAPPIYYTDEDPDGDFHPSDSDTLDEALSTLNGEIEFARNLDVGSSSRHPGQAIPPTQRIPGWQPNLRWILIHLIEEYARHCGHADLFGNGSTAQSATNAAVRRGGRGEEGGEQRGRGRRGRGEKGGGGEGGEGGGVRAAFGDCGPYTIRIDHRFVLYTTAGWPHGFLDESDEALRKGRADPQRVGALEIDAEAPLDGRATDTVRQLPLLRDRGCRRSNRHPRIETRNASSRHRVGHRRAGTLHSRAKWSSMSPRSSCSPISTRWRPTSPSDAVWPIWWSTDAATSSTVSTRPTTPSSRSSACTSPTARVPARHVPNCARRGGASYIEDYAERPNPRPPRLPRWR